jgi:Tol biopolymer transport system component
MRVKLCWLGVLWWLLGGGIAVAQSEGRDAVRSSITIIDRDGSSKRVIHTAAHRLEAPGWSPDGSTLVLNGGGKLWRLSARDGGQPRVIPTKALGWVDVNHGISPDGRSLAVTAGPIFRLGLNGGQPERLTDGSPRYFHGWAPDGHELAYAMLTGANVDIGVTDPRTGIERRLTAHSAIDDMPSYSPDGRWIFFSSNRWGGSDIWRIPRDTPAPADQQAERVTGDQFQDWFPHVSPDGQSLIFLSYHKSIQGHPIDQDVMIRRIAVPGVDPSEPTAKIEPLVRIVGGQGSIGSRPWSPDGKQFVYVSYDPPPPEMHILFFTPAGVRPPAGVSHRLTAVADAAERFFVYWMKHWGYPPVKERLFARGRDGLVKVLYVQGDRSVSARAYVRPNFATFAPELIGQATRRYHIAGDTHIWWIFTYLGDPATRIAEYRGGGTSREGGWAVVHYVSGAGEIQPELGLETGFNSTFTLKGCIHELGHALGLPHIGPVPALGLGNSLMGPNNADYKARALPHADQVYLTEAAAAMLWKHPIFSGDSARRALMPEVELSEFRTELDGRQGAMVITGKVNSDVPVHSAIVLDDLGNPDQEYWFRSAVGRIGDEGRFQVKLSDPSHTDGHYRILFAFENGAVSGDWARPDYYGAMVRPYHGAP